MGAYFITGTGTDIGKTWVCCALLRHWRAEGRQPLAFKPVMSGFDARDWAASDAGMLLAAQNLGKDQLDRVAPWRFAAPLSPDMAAAREGRAIDFEPLLEFTRAAVQRSADTVLVEGVGGVMVPLDARHTVRDWIVASRVAAVLVAGSYLGSLSHTLTALAALREVGAGITAIVVNESLDSAVSLEETAATLALHAGSLPVLCIARETPVIGVARLARWLDSGGVDAEPGE